MPADSEATAYYAGDAELPDSLSNFSVVSVDTTTKADLVVSDVVIQNGSAPLEQFVVHHVYGSEPPRGSILLFPGQGSSFAMFEIDASGEFGNSLVANLANAGYEVFGYTPRNHNIPEDGCAEETVDCSVMEQWGIDAVVDDSRFLQFLAGAAVPGQDPVVGGLSLGGMQALAILNDRPRDFAGLFLWEATLYSEDPDVTEGNRFVCDLLSDAVDAGSFFSDQVFQLFSESYNLAQEAPEDPSPMEPELTNEQFWFVLLTSPQDPPEGYVPGYTFFAGDQSTGSFTHADPDLIEAIASTLYQYDAVATMRDVRCGLAGERTHTADLGSFTGPVLALGARKGFGPYMHETVALLGTESPEEILLDGAHGDPLFNAERKTLVDDELLRWLGTID